MSQSTAAHLLYDRGVRDKTVPQHFLWFSFRGKVPDFTDCFGVFGTLCDLQNLDKQYTWCLKDRQCLLGHDAMLYV